MYFVEIDSLRVDELDPNSRVRIFNSEMLPTSRQLIVESASATDGEIESSAGR